MSHGIPDPDPPQETLQTFDLPSLPRLFDRISDTLLKRGQLGLLSITVIQRGSAEQSAGWKGYEAIVGEISAFLAGFRRDQMREGDRLFGPSVSGNAFVLLLDPPRDGRLLGQSDVRRVQSRIRTALGSHLVSHLPREIFDQFGCYVGGSLMHYDPSVKLERIVYRTLEEAFADALRDKEREQRRSTGALRRILRTGLVHAVYQPIIELPERKVIGFEALTRVTHGQFDTVELLFKTAQEADALWNLERLCRRKALEGLPPINDDQLLFLNIEPDSVHDPELRDLPFQDLLEGVGLRPDQVVLEITEHSAVRDFGAFRQRLRHFRERGFQLAMDDVGSGYSGLQAIAEIDPDYIKVDMTLIRDLHTNVIKKELIATIHRFAESTGITLIAEGVEKREELRALREAGVRYAQGFLFARPEAPPGMPDLSALD
jgi:EAL domain-containing protein (putative c-di-GMP-specific phosphodiesterase class I)